MSAALVAFWGSCALLAYTLVGYPILIAAWARLRPRAPRCDGATPSVTIVVVAHDEGPRIAARLDNLLALDYPADRLRILVCSDGSTDPTVRIASVCGDPRVSVLDFAPRRGKAAVLDDAVPHATGEIVVFADARQRFERGALRALVAPFADPRVGAVSGELCLKEEAGAAAVASGVRSYWSYEKAMRRAESLIDSSVGATGAIYAIRRRLFAPLPPTTILDDVLLPMTIVRKGYRTVFQPAARAYDMVASTAREELARKVRTIAGTFALFAQHRWLLSPRKNRVWLQTVSHKLLRLFGPAALIAALVASLLLVSLPFYRVMLALQLAVYGLALAEHARAGTPRRTRLARVLFGVPYAFCVLQAATLIGFYRFLVGRQTVTWTKARA